MFSIPKLLNVYIVMLLATYQMSLVDTTSDINTSSNIDSKNISKTFENSKFNIKLPFTDINFKSVQNVHIISVENKVFVVHGCELYVVEISRQLKELRLVAKLNGDVMSWELLGVEGVIWQNQLMLLIALTDHFEIYQIAWNSTVDSNSTSNGIDNVDPIQRIEMHGDYIQAKFIKGLNEENLFLIAAENSTTVSGRLSLHQWCDSYFRELEQRNILPLHTLHVIGENGTQPLIVAIKYHRLKTSISTFKLSGTTLAPVRSLLLRFTKMYPFAFKGVKYLLGCGDTKTSCKLFEMDISSEQFIEVKQESSAKCLRTFTAFAAGPNFLVGESLSKIFVYLDVKMECFGAFTSNVSHLTGITPYKDAEGHHFIILSYVSKPNLLLRIVEVEVTDEGDGDDMELTASMQHIQIFETSVEKFKKTLLITKSKLNSIKETLDSMGNSYSTNSPLHIRSGHIQHIRVIGRYMRSPTELSVKVKQLKAMMRIFDSRQTRVARQIDYTGEGQKSIKATVLKVNQLIYNGTLFKGIKQSPENRTLHIDIPVVTDFLVAKSFNNDSEETVLHSKYRIPANEHLEGNITTKVLFAKSINGIDWKTFHQELFLRGRDRLVTGNLVFRSRTIVDELITKTLNSMPVNHFFDLVTEQNISSNVIISRFFITSLDTNAINGVRFSDDIALVGNDNFIKSPVTIEHMGIMGNMTLSDEDHGARHIFGTQFHDFQQIYTGRVIINGTLTLANVTVETEEATVNGDLVNLDFVDRYWMRNVDQTFAQVKFRNSQIIGTRLEASVLNNHPVIDYLRVDVPKPKGFTLLVINSSEIVGNVFSEPKYPSTVNRIYRNAVMQGSTIEIQGNKIFKNIIEVNDLNAIWMGNISTEDFVRNTGHPRTITGHKNFVNIETEQLTVHNNMNADILNNATVIDDYLKFQFHFGTVEMRKPMRAKNINFEYINGHEISKILRYIEKIDNQLVLHQHVYIDGVAHFDHDLKVERINGFEWDEYRQLLVTPGQGLANVSGRKTFRHGVTVNEQIALQSINERNVSDLFGNILSKSRSQVITHPWTFDSINAENIDVTIVNNLTADSVIDMRSNTTVVYSDVVVDGTIISGSLFGDYNFSFENLHKLAKTIHRNKWQRIRVLSKATWPTEHVNETLVDYLHAYGVRRNADQVITGTVVMVKPLINSMTSINSIVENVDLEFISKDCLYKQNRDKQVITAVKVFNLHIQVNEMHAKSVVAMPYVNKIDILAFNKSIYRTNSNQVFTRKINFANTVIVDRLRVNGSINGIDFDQVYCKNIDIPPIEIPKIIISNDLTIDNVNRMEFDDLLRNRVRKHGKGQEIYGYLTFDNLVLTKNISIQSINDIQIDNVVLSTSTSVQEVRGEKTIMGNLSVLGPASVISLNNIDLIEKYRKTLFLNEDYHFDEFNAEYVSFSNGLIVRKLLNDYPFDFYLNWPERMYEKFELYLGKINSTLKLIASSNNSNITPNRKLMYIENDIRTIVDWNQSLDESYTYIRDYSDKSRHICNRSHTSIFYSKQSNKIILNSMPSITVAGISGSFNVSADIYCLRNISILEIDWRLPNIAEPFYKEVKCESFITNIAVVGTSYTKYILTEFNNNETRLFKFNLYEQGLVEQQVLKSQSSEIFSFRNKTFVILKNIHEISIYEFIEHHARLKQLQQIQNEFGTLELIEISDLKYHLITTCTSDCQKLSIYEYTTMSGTFEIHQILSVKFDIAKIIKFEITTERYLVLIPKSNIGSYHIYKYAHLQGWQFLVIGYLEDIRHVVPFSRDGGGKNYVTDLLLLAEDRISLLSLYIL